MDPNDLLDATDIASKITTSFYTQMESKKWSDRKEALEIIEKATSVPKIQNSDFSELVRVLKKTVAKDSNIVVVTTAAKCICQLAQGLRSNFSPYATSCLTILFEKYKEKKPNVNSVIRDATDAVFVATNLEEIYEDVIQYLDNKNPQIKSEMALFLVRVFSRFSSQVRNKKTLRPLINALMKTLSDMDATVRDNSAQAIGTAMKVLGESLMMPIIADVEPIKITKIKEFCEKAEIITAPINGQNHPVVPELLNGHQDCVAIVQTNGIAEDGEDDDDKIYEMHEPVDIVGQVTANFYTQMESKKWSDRKEALEVIEKATSVPRILNSDFSELVRILKKTVAKDSNIVVVTSAAKCICQLAQGLRTSFAPYATSCLTILFEKYKEKKPNVNSVIRDATDAVFVGTNLEEIFEDVIKFLDNKNPQIKSEMALFLVRVFSKFSIQVRNKKTLKPLINALIKTLSDMDSTVRDNSAQAIGTAMKVIGEGSMMPLIADVEPIKIPKIKEFCEKAQVKKLPIASITQPTTNSQAPPPFRPPAATIVRSKKLPQKVTRPIKPLEKSATVKRTATIIKRSTTTGVPQPFNAPQPSVVPPPPPSIAPPNSVVLPPQQQQHMMAPPAAIVSTPAKPVLQASRLSSNNHDLDMVIFRLISDNHEEVLDSIGELNDVPDHLLKGRINQVIDLACLQLVKSRDNHCLVQRISDFYVNLFARKQLVSTANHQSIRFLLVQIFLLIQTDQESKSLNSIASAIIDGLEPSNSISILTGLLNEPQPTSILEITKKAVIRSMKLFH